MRTDTDDADDVVPIDCLGAPSISGPLPVLAGFKGDDPCGRSELYWIARSVKAMTEEGYAVGDISILFPTMKLRDIAIEYFKDSEIQSSIFDGDNYATYFDEDQAKISTYHQVKGLEFKIVFCAGMSSKNFKMEYRYKNNEGRKTMDALLYMAITRARDRLFMSFTGTPLACLLNLVDPKGGGRIVDTQEDAEGQLIRAC
jgi:superfamily I DNA and RNA helicase